jgi:hypothetical protein
MTNPHPRADEIKSVLIASPKPGECPGCVANRTYGYGPSHDPSPRCQSGKRPHCTCDTCF